MKVITTAEEQHEYMLLCTDSVHELQRLREAHVARAFQLPLGVGMLVLRAHAFALPWPGANVFWPLKTILEGMHLATTLRPSHWINSLWRWWRKDFDTYGLDAELHLRARGRDKSTTAFR